MNVHEIHSPVGKKTARILVAGSVTTLPALMDCWAVVCGNAHSMNPMRPAITPSGAFGDASLPRIWRNVNSLLLHLASLHLVVTLKRLAGPFRELGVWAGTLYTVQYALRPLQKFAALFVYELVQQPVPATPSLPARHLAQMRWLELGPDSTELAKMPPPDAVKRMRFAQGARCIAVYRKSDFIGYVWFCFRQYEEDEVRCVYELKQPATSAFDFDFYIFPEYRLGRAFATMWDAANEFLRGNGVTHTYSRISRFNMASRQAHARLGARVLATALFLRVGPCELSWSQSAGFPPLRLTLSQRVRIRL